MRTTLILACAAAALASCNQEPQSNTRPIKVRSEEQNQLHRLDALNLAIGQQTPPVASVLMLTCSIAKESVWDVTKANLPFIGVLLATLLLITYVPVTTLGLVQLFYR